MSNEEARGILDHLIQEMESNGYGEVSRQVRIKIQETFSGESNNADMNDRNLLDIYLDTSIRFLSNISSSSIEPTIRNINSFLEEGKIEQIEVVQINKNQINLAELPDYSPVIKMLLSVRTQLNNE